MPDPFGQAEQRYQKEAGDPFSQASKRYQSEQRPSQWGELGSALWNDAKGVVKTGFKLQQAVQGNVSDQEVVDTVKDVGRGFADRTTEESGKARDAFGRGDYVKGVAHSVASVPVVGGLLGDLGQDAMSVWRGEWGKPAAHAIELLGPKMAERLPASTRLSLTPKSVLNPVEQDAMNSVKGSVRTTAGQQTGNVGLQRIEQGMVNLPGASTRAHQFYAGAEDDLANKGTSLANRAGLKKATPYEAGQDMTGRLTDRFKKLKTQADKFYDNVRSATAKNQVTVQTGSKPTGLFGPSGQALTTPVTQVFESPVALAPMRANLKVLYDDIRQLMPEARQQLSPAFKALDSLMKSDMTHMSAMDFDKFLGAVKAFVREDGQSEFLTTQSQALGKKLIREGEAGLDNALKGAGADVPGKLKSARNLVKSYYETGEIMAEFPTNDPAGIYQKLAVGGDRAVEKLKRLQQIAPKETKVIGRTFIEGLLDRAMNEGGFERAAGIKEAWRAMGPKTKELLYGPELTKDLDRFLLASKRLTTNLNHGSGPTLLAFGGLGALGAGLGAALSYLVTGDGSHLIQGMETGASMVMIPNVLSRVMFSPGGVKALTAAMTVPVRSPAYRTAQAAVRVRVLNALAAEKKERAEENQQTQ